MPAHGERTYRGAAALSALLACAALMLVAATSATAQSCAPGGGALEEYCLTLPGAGGEQGPGASGGEQGGGGSGGGAQSGSAIPPATVSALRAQGSDGQGVLGFAASTSGAGSGERSAGGVSGDRASGGTRQAGPFDDRLAALGSGVESGPQSDVGFVVALIAATLGFAGFAGFAFARRRRAESG